MQELKGLDKPALIDLLSQYTARYTQLLRDPGDDDEYFVCKNMIMELLNEIHVRRGVTPSIEQLS